LQAQPHERPSSAKQDFKAKQPLHKWNNYIARHWRGELSLPISYWINGFLANITIVIIATIITKSDLKTDFRPEIALSSIILVWTTGLLIFVWQLVGVWRSATNYKIANPTKSWGGLAKFIMILALLRTVGDFTQHGIPQINEYYKIYAGDEKEVVPVSGTVWRLG